jgi:hypothetical protein
MNTGIRELEPIGTGADGDLPPRTFTRQTNQEFALYIGDVSFALREHGVLGKLSKVPLRKLDDFTEMLDDKPDTLEGSTVRTIVFDGFTLTLFASRENTDDYWVLKMTATGAGARTHRGIRPGDSVERMLDVYRLEDLVLSGNVYQFINVDPNESLEFAVNDGVVERISLIYSQL